MLNAHFAGFQGAEFANMTTYTWTTTGIRGDWATSAAWSPGSGPPGAGDVAIFGNLARNYSVNVAAADVVGVSTINIGPVSSSGLPTLSIAGSLTTGTLLYSTPATGPAARIMVNSGGLFDITTSLPAPARAETISVSGKRAGGHLELGTLSLGAVPNLTFDFSNNVGGLLNSGIIEFQSGYFVGAVANQRFTSVGRGDEFIIDGATFTGDTVTLDSTTHKLTVSDGTTIVFTMSDVNLANNTPNNFRIVGTNIIEAVCYARGTMIRTPDGELPVEKLRPGRQVVVLVDGQEVPQTVTWLGHRRIASHQPSPAGDRGADPHPTRRLRRQHAAPRSAGLAGSRHLRGRHADLRQTTGERHHHPPGDATGRRWITTTWN